MHAYLPPEAIVWFSSVLVTGGVTLVDGSSAPWLLDTCCVVMFSVGAVCVHTCGTNSIERGLQYYILVHSHDVVGGGFVGQLDGSTHVSPSSTVPLGQKQPLTH